MTCQKFLKIPVKGKKLIGSKENDMPKSVKKFYSRSFRFYGYSSYAPDSEKIWKVNLRFFFQHLRYGSLKNLCPCMHIYSR